MGIKNKRSKSEEKGISMFGTRMQYEMFCFYWKHVCGNLNKKSANCSEV